MPVRFRCVYCNQLLGISRRKAGTVVRCTNCEGQIIVPEPERQPVAADRNRLAAVKEHQSLPGNFAEKDDFDELLKPFDFGSPEPVALAAPADSMRIEPVPAITMGPAYRARLLIGLGWAFTAIFTFIIGFAIGRCTVPTP